MDQEPDSIVPDAPYKECNKLEAPCCEEELRSTQVLKKDILAISV